MVRKLPRNICDRWGREVNHWLSNKGQEREGSRASDSPYPPFNFLKREARIACNPLTMTRVAEEKKKTDPPQRNGSSNLKREPPGAKSFATGSEEVKNGRKEDKKQPERCRLCKNTHNLDECNKFTKMSHAERMEVVRSNGLCLGCLKFGHMKKDCRGRKVCASCKGFHPTSLHIDVPKAPQKETKPVVPPNNSTAEATSHRVNALDARDSQSNST